MRPTISVCCITYNHQDYIEDCIKGFLKQVISYDVEFLIHDDASTDQTQSLLKSLVGNDPRFKLILRKNNIKSTGKAIFPILFKESKGSYIAMCEGDDYWTDPLKLQKQVDFLEANPDYVMAYHDFLSVRDLRTEKTKSPLSDSDKIDSTAEDLMLCRKFVKTLTLCFRNVIKDLPEEFSFVKNGDTFLISYLGNSGKGKWMGNEIEPGVYRVHDGGIWSLMNLKQQRINSITTNYWLFQYYNRIGKLEISKAWYNNLVEFLGLAEKEAYNLNKSSFKILREKERELIFIKNSTSYKIGRFISSPFRFVKTLLK